MKKIIYLILFGLLAFNANAQEPAIYSQYQVFPVLINPGYAGFDNQHNFILNARSSWTGFPGAPQSYSFLYTGPVGDKLALGGGIFAEQIGDQNLVKLHFNYAFRFQLEKFKIGLGLTTDFLRRSVNNDLLDDPIVNPNDPVLEDLADGQQIFDASVGIHTIYDDHFFLDISLPNTVRARLDEVPVANEEEKSSLFEHYIFQLGYIFDVPSQNFKIIPSLALRNIRDVPYQVDVNVQGRFLDEKLIAGLTYRPSSDGAVAFLLGTKYKTIQFIYSYDVSFGNFQQYNGGSHELSFALSLQRKTPLVSPTPVDPYQ